MLNMFTLQETDVPYRTRFYPASRTIVNDTDLTDDEVEAILADTMLDSILTYTDELDRQGFVSKYYPSEDDETLVNTIDNMFDEQTKKVSLPLGESADGQIVTSIIVMYRQVQLVIKWKQNNRRQIYNYVLSYADYEEFTESEGINDEG